jgi:hypothetical protein
MFPLEAALVNPEGIVGMILIEPGMCPTSYSASQIQTVASIPTLIVFGDYLDTPTGIPGHSWQTTAFESCQSYVEQISKAGGEIQMMYLPDEGIPGNSHMIMQDLNNTEVADMIIDWMNINALR